MNILYAVGIHVQYSTIILGGMMLELITHELSSIYIDGVFPCKSYLMLSVL